MPFKVLRTESQSDFAKLHADFTECINPTNVIERGYVNEMAHHTWEIMRYQRIATGILNNALRRALALLVNEILLPPSLAMGQESWMPAQQIAYEWLLDLDTNRRSASMLKEAKYDESAIEAKAYTLVGDDLEHVNRLLRAAQDGRDKVLRSIAKYRKSFADQLRQSSDSLLVADEVSLIASGEDN
jgi:hypothetical protein